MGTSSSPLDQLEVNVKRLSGRELQQDYMVLRSIKHNFLYRHRSAVPEKDAYSEVKSFDSGVPFAYIGLRQEDSSGGGPIQDMIAAKTRHPSRGRLLFASRTVGRVSDYSVSCRVKCIVIHKTGQEAHASMLR